MASHLFASGDWVFPGGVILCIRVVITSIDQSEYQAPPSFFRNYEKEANGLSQ